MDRLLIGGGYVPLTSPAEELVRLGHEHDVPVYPCVNCGAPVQGADSELRAAASNILWTGADGIYLWNYQYRDVPKLGYGRPVDEAYGLLDEIGSAASLRYTDKSFSLERRVGVESYVRACHPAQLPARVEGFSGAALRLRVGDDVGAADDVGRLEHATLRLDPYGLSAGAQVNVEMNGLALAPADPESPNTAFDVPSSAVHPGDNKLQVRVAGQTIGTPLVEAVSLDVSYRR